MYAVSSALSLQSLRTSRRNSFPPLRGRVLLCAAFGFGVPEVQLATVARVVRYRVARPLFLGGRRGTRGEYSRGAGS